MDYIHNGQGYGSTAAALIANNFNPRILRPYIAPETGLSYVDMTHNGKIVPVLQRNATATLLRDEWKIIDRTVLRVARDRLRVWNDLRASGLTLNIPNGMSKTVIESQTMGDITPAMLSMDPANESDADALEFGMVGLPLPVVHKDFHFTARQIAVARSGGAPLDTTMVELATRKCAEEIEKLTLGVSSTYKYAGYTVYGMRNHPNRSTFTITDPTSLGWTPDVFLGELLEMRQLLVDENYFGPYRLYLSPAWLVFLDNDYSAAKGDNTLRERIAKLGFVSIETVDYLPSYDVIMYQATSDVVQAVTGMNLTTLQWEEQGGMILKFKVLGIMVPRVRADADGNVGIVHGAI